MNLGSPWEGVYPALAVTTRFAVYRPHDRVDTLWRRHFRLNRELILEESHHRTIDRGHTVASPNKLSARIKKCIPLGVCRQTPRFQKTAVLSSRCRAAEYPKATFFIKFLDWPRSETAHVESPVKMDERQFYRESQVSKAASLTCSFCRTTNTYDLRWLVRRKVDRMPKGADERDRAKFSKAASYMVLVDDKVTCKEPRCRRTFEVSGLKTTAFLTD